MRGIAHKLRLILAGVIVSLAQPSIGQVSAPPARDASLLNTGTLADARLSSNVALYDASMASFSSGTLPDARLSSNVALYDASMASFSSGTLPDARLSANIPRLDSANVFTAEGSGVSSAPITITAELPKLLFHDSNGDADANDFDLTVAGGSVQLRALSDIGAVFSKVQVAPGSIDLSAGTVTANGDDVLTGGWANVEFDGDVVGKGGAITGVTRDTTGSYTVTVSGFTSTSSFACTATAANDEFASLSISTASQVQVRTRDDDGTFNDSNFMIICTGH